MPILGILHHHHVSFFNVLRGFFGFLVGTVQTLDGKSLAPAAGSANDGDVTTQELLDKVNAAISARLDGQAIDEWSEGGHRVKHMSLEALLRSRGELQNQLEQETGGICMPVVDVNV